MADEQTSTKKLSAEEIERSAQRLTQVTRKEVVLKDLVPHHQLSKDDEERAIKRLYSDALEAKARKKEQLAQKEKTANSKDHTERRLDQAEEQEAISRLYEKAIESRRAEMEGLTQKLAAPLENKKLDKEAQEVVNTRLYTESGNKHRESRTKLFEKYVVDREPKSAKMTKEQLAESAARLTAKK
jgi:hypothetical protein